MSDHIHVWKSDVLHWLEDGSYHERQARSCEELRFTLLARTPVESRCCAWPPRWS